MTQSVTPQHSLDAQSTQTVLDRLRLVNSRFMAQYPGESGDRQPVHVVYGGAQLFKSDTAVKMGGKALKALEENAAHFGVFARVLGLPGADTLPEGLSEIQGLKAELDCNAEGLKKSHPAAWLAYTIYQRVVDKLKKEPVEDFRIDFEDGYGNRPDAEEDAQAVIAAEEVAQGMKDGTLSPFIGIRIKPFTEELAARSIRTLDIFLTTLLTRTGGKLPDNFVVTLPKVALVEQVAALAELLGQMEQKHRLPERALKLELMVEITQAIIDLEGNIPLPRLVQAADGRCVGAHFGTYDYTASCSITAAYQDMKHPACDFAKHVMKVSLAGTGVLLSDGATNIMPVGPHRGDNLTTAQRLENQQVVHGAWKIHVEHTRHSLINGYYQGWDLHPAQLPTRFGTVYAFFLEGLEAASIRLKNFIDKAAQATLVGDVFDDAATGQGLLNYFLRGINCGAITEAEAMATGLTLDEIRGKSFVRILNARRQQGH